MVYLLTKLKHKIQSLRNYVATLQNIVCFNLGECVFLVTTLLENYKSAEKIHQDIARIG